MREPVRSVDEVVNERLGPYGWWWDRERASLRRLSQQHLDVSTPPRLNDVIYTVPLFDMRTSADMLDWIFQLRQKTWVTDAEMGAVVFALDELLRPQTCLCSRGIEHGPIDVVAELSRRA